MPRTFIVADVAELEPGVWAVWLDVARGSAGRALFAGSAEELVSELNGRQRAIYGNALEGRLISLGGLTISVRE